MSCRYIIHGSLAGRPRRPAENEAISIQSMSKSSSEMDASKPNGDKFCYYTTRIAMKVVKLENVYCSLMKP